jgi:hypothetical protein
MECKARGVYISLLLDPHHATAFVALPVLISFWWNGSAQTLHWTDNWLELKRNRLAATTYDQVGILLCTTYGCNSRPGRVSRLSHCKTPIFVRGGEGQPQQYRLSMFSRLMTSTIKEDGYLHALSGTSRLPSFLYCNLPALESSSLKQEVALIPVWVEMDTNHPPRTHAARLLSSSRYSVVALC